MDITTGSSESMQRFLPLPAAGSTQKQQLAPWLLSGKICRIPAKYYRSMSPPAGQPAKSYYAANRQRVQSGDTAGYYHSPIYLQKYKM